MPAVDLSRLRTRLDLLLRSSTEPKELARGIREIFDFYADPTQPVNSVVEAGTELRFNTPQVLGLEVEKSLQSFVLENPTDILEVVDILWRFPEIELQQLAARLLGRIPAEYKNEVILRIDQWSKQSLDTDQLSYLHQMSTVNLRKQDASSWLELLKKWTSSGKPEEVTMALHGLLPLIEDKSFANLPQIFSFLYPFFQPFRKELNYELATVIIALSRRSEIETVYFLKQMMGIAQEQAYGRFVRRLLEHFSPSNQASLRSALKEHPALS